MVNLLPLFSVINDLGLWRKDLVDSLLGDFTKVTSLVNTRGISFLMIDMPDACKVLDASLSSGFMDFASLPHTMRKGGKTNPYSPQLFKCLFDELFSSSGRLLDDPDINIIFFLRQILLLHKKVDMPCPHVNVERAISEFVQIESQMRNYSFGWHIDQPDYEILSKIHFGDSNNGAPLLGERPLPSLLIEAFEKVVRLVTSEFPILDPTSIIPKHGPGAVADGKGNFDKYSFPSWPSKLSQVFPPDYFGVGNYNLMDDQVIFGEKEAYAQLIAVPKTLKAPRLIASEPTSHQFLQQGLLRWFRENLPRTLSASIDFLSQEKSKKEALLSSLDGRTGTVDLSSASDRLSCWVVERFFRSRPDILSALHAVRTRVVKIPHGPVSMLLLKKHANQGSAVTFPLQSIIYACICVACVLFEDGLKPSSKNIRHAFSRVRVFGDDLIVPVNLSYSLGLLMSYLGLKVNVGKTHMRGAFRESCGMDAYAGVDITPVYLSNLQPGEDYSGLSSWIDSSNVAYSRGLWALSDYMIKCIPEKFARFLPISPVPLSCLYLRTTQKFTMTPQKTRWNVSTQNVEGLSLTANVKKRTGGRVGSQDLLHYFISAPENCISNSIDIFDISRRRSFDYRVRLRIRWVPLSVLAPAYRS